MRQTQGGLRGGACRPAGEIFYAPVPTVFALLKSRIKSIELLYDCAIEFQDGHDTIPQIPSVKQTYDHSVSNPKEAVRHGVLLPAKPG